MAKESIDYKTVYQLIDDRTNRILEKVDSLGARVGIIENWRSNIMGQLTIMIAVVGFIMALVTGWIKEKFKI